MPASDSPLESRAARSLTDRSRTGETSEGETLPREPTGRPRVWPRVVGVLILLIGAGGAWIWQNPGFVPMALRSVFPGSTAHDTEANEIKTLDDRVTRVEQQVREADLASVTQRLDALEKRLPASDQIAGQTSPGQNPIGPMAAQVDLRPLEARLDALEARSALAASPSGGSPAPAIASGRPPQGPGPDLQVVFARLAALEKEQAQNTVDPAKVSALASRVDALAARDPTAELRGKLDTVEHRLSDLSANETKLANTSDRAARVARIEGADIALAAGQPLGVIPDAPAALTRFATTAPPTEAGLRLSFSEASRAALKVSRPDAEGKPFLDRVLARLRDFRLITVREGDRVVIGNSTAATLARARMLLNAGDLNGAVREVAMLSGPPAEQMASWLAGAKALQAAREALLSLAENN